MRLPRLRLTMRRMMVVVAGFGLLLGSGVYLAGKTDPLARGYRNLADEHAIRASQLSMEIAYAPSKSARNLPLIRHHSAMEAKYSRAARYPWLPVAPDPPEPE